MAPPTSGYGSHLPNGPIDVPGDRTRVGGSNFFLQALHQKAKLQLRRDHALEKKVEPVVRVERQDLLGQIADPLRIVCHGASPQGLA